MKCHWEEIDRFRSPSEFTRFVGWIEAQLQSGNATEVTARDHLAGEAISERRFVCMKCLSTWRLMYPDPGYSTGAFCPLKASRGN